MDSWLRLSEIASMAQGELRGNDAEITGISTDTRNLHFGDLFVALEGERFDGHKFIDETVEQVVQGVLIHKDIDTKIPSILVEDTLVGLSHWAHAWKKVVNPKLIAVTGSNGKTTVKQMLSNVLTLAGSTCYTQGNLNNHIGVPLTLLSMRKQNQYAVIEMGANHFGEIDRLSKLAEPDVAIITNAGPAHLEGFGSIAGVARAKSEIINRVKPDGVVVLNADDPYLNVWLAKAQHLEVTTFGFDSTAEIHGDLIESNILSVNVPGHTVDITLPLLGKHNAYNALAAAAAALTLGIDIEEIRKGLESANDVKGRLQAKKGVLGATILDDTYNANPASLQAAIDVLCAQNKEPWLVLGDMGELGQEAAAIHAQIGLEAKHAGVKKLFGLGELAMHAVEKFGENGFHFHSHDSLSRELLAQMSPDICILIKGSRAMHMEDVVNLLIENETIH